MPRSYHLAAPPRFDADRDGDLANTRDPTCFLRHHPTYPPACEDPVLANIPRGRSPRPALRPKSRPQWLLWIAASAASLSFASTGLTAFIGIFFLALELR